MKKLTLPLLLLLFACYKPEETITTADVFPGGIQFSKDSLLASGSDKSTVMVMLPDDTKEGLKITFTCESGGLGSDGLKKLEIPVEKRDEKWLAETIYTSPLKAGLDPIKASISKYTEEKKMQLTFNNAESIQITSDSVGIRQSPSSDLVFTLQLLATSGKPSIGNETTFKVVDATGNPVGTLFNPSSESNSLGQCSYSFSLLPDFDVQGPLFAKASLSNFTNDSVSFTFYVYP